MILSPKLPGTYKFNPILPGTNNFKSEVADRPPATKVGLRNNSFIPHFGISNGGVNAVDANCRHDNLQLKVVGQVPP